MMKSVWQCMFSPRLFKIFRDEARESTYEPRGLEKWGDKIISTANTVLNIGLYTSPFICMYIYRRGFYSLDETRYLAKFFGGIGCLIAFAFLIRAIGRVSSSKYMKFMTSLKSPLIDKKSYLEGIRKYDFEFHAWPVTYTVPPQNSSSPYWLLKNPFNSCANMDLPVYQRAPLQVVALFATHIFGLRLIYPGCLGLVQNLLNTPLLQGRAQLVENFNGQRTKVQTAEGNCIDTMFIDNRSKSPKGNVLVICCEGNSGFYEIGIMTTPIKSGYSALGWNHPGFAGSTGLPFPNQERNAIDAVIQYAINELNFKPSDIVMFGWSIGGYTASVAAVEYPEVKALVLDASFDDLLPLAQNQMPSSWSRLVREVVRSYVNLNIAELVAQYPGPVKLVRRTEDEIICLRQGQISTNRGNELLFKLIETRHPELSKEDRIAVEKYTALVDTQRATILRNEVREDIKRSIALIGKYMHDYKSSHCTPLPEDYFRAIMDSIENAK